MTLYLYGMKYRGYSPGCQPMRGLHDRVDDPAGKYHDILRYVWRLPEANERDYELDYLGEEEES